uniref:Uncharacterized protein n=1 Tax=Colobus angolensis palliatus TaxID=336983 RepID=A0A2K5IA99_COLAP
MNGDDAFARRPRVGAQIPEKIQKPFDDIAKYFSKKEWEKMKASEKIIYVTLPPFMRNKRATDFQGNDSDNDRNCGNQVERPQMTFSMLQGIFPKIMPKKPAEEGNDSKGVAEASGPQNDGKQLCPPGKTKQAQEKEERRGTAHWWSSQTTHNIGPKRRKHAWTQRLRERKQLVIYEEIKLRLNDEIPHALSTPYPVYPGMLPTQDAVGSQTRGQP